MRALLSNKSMASYLKPVVVFSLALLLFSAIFVLSAGSSDPASDPVGITKQGENFVLWNDENEYFIHEGGIQISNQPPGVHWANISMCYRKHKGGSWGTKKCAEELNWVWQNETDDSTYVNLTGRWDGANETIWIRYHLELGDVMINKTFRHKNQNDTEDWFQLIAFEEHHWIEINEDYANDWAKAWKGGNEQAYDLSQTLDVSETNLDNLTYFIYDNTTTAFIQENWTSYYLKNGLDYSMPYEVRLVSNAEPNTPTKLLLNMTAGGGPITAGDWVQTDILWVDAGETMNLTIKVWDTMGTTNPADDVVVQSGISSATVAEGATEEMGIVANLSPGKTYIWEGMFEAGGSVWNLDMGAEGYGAVTGPFVLVDTGSAEFILQTTYVFDDTTSGEDVAIYDDTIGTNPDLTTDNQASEIGNATATGLDMYYDATWYAEGGTAIESIGGSESWAEWAVGHKAYFTHVFKVDYDWADGTVQGISFNCRGTGGDNDILFKYNFTIADTTSPIWRNQNENDTTPDYNASVLLSSEWYDETNLSWCLLATNESGTWQNFTTLYGSPYDITGSATWTWGNFTWQNESYTSATEVCWYTSCNDTTATEGNWNSTNISCFNTSGTGPPNTAPIVVSISPVNETNTTNNTTIHTFNFTDPDDSSANCTLYYNSTSYGNNDSTQNNTNTDITSSEVADGIWEWWVNCTDSVSNENQSEIRIITIDTTGPSITFELPTPNNETSGNNWTYINVSGIETLYDAVLEWNGTNETMNGSGTEWYQNKSALSNGNYTFMVYANDSFNNTGVSGTKWVYINYTEPNSPPTVNIESPASGWTNNNATTHYFNFTDAGNTTANCTLYYDTTPLVSNESTQNATSTPLTPSEQSEANYTWLVRCDEGNASNSSERWIYIDVSAPVINEVNDSPDPVYQDQTINITANVTDALIGVDTVTFDINGTNYTGVPGETDIWYYDSWDTNVQANEYNYTVYANDSLDNNATNVSGSFTVQTGVIYWNASSVIVDDTSSGNTSVGNATINSNGTNNDTTVTEDSDTCNCISFLPAGPFQIGDGGIQEIEFTVEPVDGLTNNTEYWAIYNLTSTQDTTPEQVNVSFNFTGWTYWNQTSLNIGTVAQGQSDSSNASVIAVGNNSNVEITEDSATNGSSFMNASPIALNAIADNSDNGIEFNCSPSVSNSTGVYEANYTLNSSEYPEGVNISVSCNVSLTAVTWNTSLVVVSNTGSGNSSLGNATITSSGTNNDTTVTEDSDSCNCISFLPAGPFQLGNSETQEIEFDVSPVDGLTNNTEYWATYNLTSTQDTSNDTINVSFTFLGWTYWNQTTLDIGSVGQGSSGSKNASVIAVGNNSEVNVTESGGNGSTFMNASPTALNAIADNSDNTIEFTCAPSLSNATGVYETNYTLNSSEYTTGEIITASCTVTSANASWNQSTIDLGTISSGNSSSDNATINSININNDTSVTEDSDSCNCISALPAGPFQLGNSETQEVEFTVAPVDGLTNNTVYWAIYNLTSNQDSTPDVINISFTFIGWTYWNQTSLNIGTVAQGQSDSSNASVIAVGNNSNVEITEDPATNGSSFMNASPTALNAIADNSDNGIEFNCSPSTDNATGVYETNYTVNSSEYPEGVNISVSCNVSLTAVTWNTSSVVADNTSSGNSSLRNATISSSGINNDTAVTEDSDTCNCISFTPAGPFQLGNSETQEVEFTVAPVDGLTNNTEYWATYNLTSSQDTSNDTINVSFTFIGWTYWNQTTLNLGSIYQGSSTSSNASVIAVGNNSNVEITENGGNGSTFMNASPTTLDPITDNSNNGIQFSCSPSATNASGVYETNYTLNSSEYSEGVNISVSCTVTETSINWNTSILDLGNASSGNSSTGNATISSNGTNNDTTVIEDSDTCNCISFLPAGPFDLGDGGTQEIEFNVSPVDGLTNNTEYWAIYNLTSTQDTSNDTINVSFTFIGWTYWDQTSLNIGTVAQGQSDSSNASAIAVGNNSNVEITEDSSTNGSSFMSAYPTSLGPIADNSDNGIEFNCSPSATNATGVYEANYTLNSSEYDLEQNITVTCTVSLTAVTWNTSLVVVDNTSSGNSSIGNATISSSGINNNTTVAEDSDSCGCISPDSTGPFELGQGSSQNIDFTVAPVDGLTNNTEYWAIYNVTSTQDTTPEQVNVSFNFTGWVYWNQTTLNIGSVGQDSSGSNNASVIAVGNNSEVNVTESGGNGSSFMNASPTTLNAIADNSQTGVEFACSPSLSNATGIYETNYTLNSSEYTTGEIITASCTVTSANASWNQSTIDLGTISSGNSSSDNATINSININNDTNVTEDSDNCNCISALPAGPFQLGNSETQEIEFNVSPVDGLTNNTLYWATYNITSNQDSTPDVINISFTFVGWTYWNQTSLNIGTVAQGQSDSSNASVIAVGNNSNVEITEDSATNGSSFMNASPTALNAIADNSQTGVEFACAPSLSNATGVYETNYTVNSTEYDIEQNITVTCTVTLTAVTWNASLVVVDNTSSGNSSTGNATISSSGVNNATTVTEDSDTCNCISFLPAGPFELGQSETQDMEFTVAPVDGLTNNTEYWAIYNVTSTQDTTPEQVNVSFNFTGWVYWNQTSLNIGTVAQQQSDSSNASVIAVGNNSNVEITEDSSTNGSSFMEANPTTLNAIADNSQTGIEFNCSPSTDNATGVYETNYTVNSSEYSGDVNISVTCTVALTAVTWNTSSVVVSNTGSGNTSLGNATISSSGINNGTAVTEDSDNCNCITPDQTGPFQLGQGASQDIEFTVAPVDGLTNNTEYWATYNLTSTQDTSNDTINVSFTFLGWTYWNQTTLDIGSVGQGSSGTNNASVIAVGNNSEVNITESGGNGSTFMNASPTSLGALSDNSQTGVEFACSPSGSNATGVYETNYTLNSSEYTTAQIITASCTVSETSIDWNQSTLDIGPVYPNGNISNEAIVNSTGSNADVVVTELSGNGSDFMQANVTNIGSMGNGDLYSVTFNCSPNLTQGIGVYETNYTVNSSVDGSGDNITVSCTVVQPVIYWNQSSTDIGTVNSGTSSSGEALVLSNGTNANVNVVEESDNCNCISPNITSLGTMGNGTQTGVSFTATPASGLTNNSIYWAIYNVTSNQDTSPDQINISFTYNAWAYWNQSTLDIGSVGQGSTGEKTADVLSVGNTSNVEVTELSGNGSSFMAANVTTIGSIENNQSYEVTFNCSPSATNATGVYETNYSVNSTEYSSEYNITVTCTVSLTEISWNASTVVVDATSSGNSSTGNATMTSSGTNNNTTVTEISDSCNCISFSPSGPFELGQSGTQDIDFTVSPVDGLINNTEYWATYNLTSNQDISNDTINVSFTFIGWTYWNQTSLDIGTVGQGSSGSASALVIAVGNNSDVNVTESGGNGSSFMNASQTTLNAIADNSQTSIEFNCTPSASNSSGVYETNYTLNSSEYTTAQIITVSCTVSETSIDWNASTLDLGSVSQGSEGSGNASVNSTGANSNVIVTELSGNGSSFMAASPTSLGSLINGESLGVNFTCNPSTDNATGVYEAVYNVNSSQDTGGDNITITCTVTTAPASVDWNQSTLNIGSVQKGRNSTKNATVTSTQNNSFVTVTELSGNGSSFMNASPVSLGNLTNGETAEVEFICDPLSSQSTGSYETIYTVNSSEDAGGDNITVSCNVTTGAGVPPPGGGGGGGSKKEPKTEKIELTLENPSKEVALEIADAAILRIGGKSHKVRVKDIIGTQVTLDVSFGPGSVILGITEPEYIDLDGDGIDDLVITLNRVRRGLADITFFYLGTGEEINVTMPVSSTKEEISKILEEVEEIQASPWITGYFVLAQATPAYLVVILMFLGLMAILHYYKTIVKILFKGRFYEK